MEGNINMKYIAILGSTGSIGTQTLEVVRAQQDIKVTALSAGDNIDLLEQQIREFRPALAAVKTEEKAKELALRISDLNIPVLSGSVRPLPQLKPARILLWQIKRRL